MIDREVKSQTCPALRFDIFIGGDVRAALEAVRRFTLEEGLCVSITPRSYVYTGGMEEGVEATLINYPRFPKEADVVEDTAKRLGAYLMGALCQGSYTVQGPQSATFYSRRGDIQ